MSCKKCIHKDICPKAKNPENYAFSDCKDFKNAEDFEEVVHCNKCANASADGLCFASVSGLGYRVIRPSGFCDRGIKTKNSN